MSLAVLVLGFREPEVLARVLPVYRQAGFDVYLHVDGKASAFDYARALGAQSRHCHVIQDRVAVFWGGFTMIEATMRLLRAAIAADKYDNFLLVSDDTLPVVPPETLRAQLTRPVERISARPVLRDEPFRKRYEDFYFFDHHATALLGRPIETAALDDAFFGTLARLVALRERGKQTSPLFYGSQWWCLTRGTAALVLHHHADRPHQRESFEFSAVPDESYIQSIVANHANAHQLIGGPVYVDWTREPKPYIFRDESFRAGLLQHHYFVRKVSARDRNFLERALIGILQADEQGYVDNGSTPGSAHFGAHTTT